MATTKRLPRKAVVAQEDCVACGCCVKVCPRQALTIHRGLYAVVDRDRCVGCGRCAAECPASVIEMEEAAG